MQSYGGELGHSKGPFLIRPIADHCLRKLCLFRREGGRHAFAVEEVLHVGLVERFERRLDKSSFRRRLDERKLLEPVGGEFVV